MDQRVERGKERNGGDRGSENVIGKTVVPLSGGDGRREGKKEGEFNFEV
jgi:hypothetical protein